jgi:hypothetical protein
VPLAATGFVGTSILRDVGKEVIDIECDIVDFGRRFGQRRIGLDRAMLCGSGQIEGCVIDELFGDGPRPVFLQRKQARDTPAHDGRSRPGSPPRPESRKTRPAQQPLATEQQRPAQQQQPPGTAAGATGRAGWKLAIGRRMLAADHCGALAG